MTEEVTEHVETEPSTEIVAPPEATIKVKSIYDQALDACEASRISLPDKGNPPVDSSNPAYWAKRNHTACYGRGIVGKFHQKVDTNTYTTDYICSCATNRWEKWKNSFVKEWLRSRAGSIPELKQVDNAE
jgi:hypothetical protein